MSRKINRVPVKLDAKGIKALSKEEIVTILRGADPLIMCGGRAMLAKILKGSREKKLLEQGLDKVPVYAAFKALSLEDIQARIDWMILNDYLTIEYDYRLPLIVYTNKGWEIERETYATELLQGIDKLIASDELQLDMTYLKDRNRDIIMLLLDKIQASENPKYLPVLAAWKKVDYKKVQLRITQVMQGLEQTVA